MERRFDQPDLRVIKEQEMLLISAANGKLEDLDSSFPATLSKYINEDIDQEHLKIQLMIPDMVNTAFGGSFKKVTTTVQQRESTKLLYLL